MAIELTQRIETWLFQRVVKRNFSQGRHWVLKRLPYNMVEYDGNPNQYVEPVPVQVVPSVNALGVSTDGQIGGQVYQWKIVGNRPFAGFTMNDNLDITNPSTP